MADGRTVDIEGTGSILNHNCSLVPGFPSALLSVSQINKFNKAISIFTSTDCKIIKLDNKIDNLLRNITTTAEQNNLVLVNGKEENGIYKCLFNDLGKNKQPKSFKLTNATDKFAGASYYTNVPSARVDSIKELVRFFHETWNHASMELMISIVKHKLIINIPETLTEKAIRKHFPNCNACPVGNLQQRPALSLPAERELTIGQEWEIDLTGPMTDE